MDYLREYGLVGAFDSVCMCTGEDDCLVFDEDNENISYLELQYRSIAIASQLIHRLRVLPQNTVLFLVDDETGPVPGEIAALLATLRSRAIFVPVNPRHGGLQRIIDNCAPVAAIVMAQSDNAQVVRLLSSHGVHRLCLIDHSGQLIVDEANPADIRDDIIADTDEVCKTCAYILYTSGSTGVPKGVRGTHNGLIARLQWAHTHLTLEPEEVCLRRTPLTFVDSWVEILFPLLSGNALYIPAQGIFKTMGLAGIASQLDVQGVTRITVLPSQVAQALSLSSTFSSSSAWPCLRTCIVSGEPCPATLIAQFRLAFPTATLVNLFGSTEISGDICAAILSPPELALPLYQDKMVPIGRCMGECGDCIVVSRTSFDEGSAAVFTVPDGVLGELVVRGSFVADGYHDLPEETNKRFLRGLTIDGVAYSGTTFFRTDDIVFKQKDVFYWCGRADNQCKLAGGIRVELEGIEASFLNVLGWSSGLAVLAVAWAVDDGGGDENNKRIVMLYEQTGPGIVGKEAILKCLQDASLPTAWLPTLIMAVESIPRNATGKVDRVMLTSFFQDTRTRVQSLTTLERPAAASSVLVQFQNMLLAVMPRLHLSSLDLAKDTFSSLGGSSIEYVEFTWRIRCEFHIKTFAWSRNLWQEPLTFLLQEVSQHIQDASSSSSSTPNPPSKKARMVIGGGIASDESSSLVVSWSHRLTRCVDAGPFLFSGNIYIGDHMGRVVCLSATSGALLWRVNLQGSGDHLHIEAKAAASFSRSLLFVPSFSGKSRDGSGTLLNQEQQDEGTVAVASLKHNDAALNSNMVGVLWALNFTNGDRMWSLSMPGEMKSTPVVLQDSLLVFTHCGIHLVGILDGTLLKSLCQDLSFYACPAMKTSLSSDSAQIYCASTTGQLVSVAVCALQDDMELAPWSEPIDGSFSSTDLVPPPIFASPLLLEDREYLVYGAIDAAVRCISVRQSAITAPPSAPLWTNTLATRPIFSSCADVSSDALVFGCHDNWLRCLNAEDGKLLWETDCHSVIFATPAVLQRDFIVAATTGGDVHVLSADTGAILSTARLPGEIYSSPICDGLDIFIGCRDDCVYKLTFILTHMT